MLNKVLLILCLLLLSSCNPLLKLAVGYKKPKAETRESIRAFAQKHKVDTSEIIYSEPSYLTSFSKGVATVQLYNAFGENLSPKESSCPTLKYLYDHIDEANILDSSRWMINGKNSLSSRIAHSNASEDIILQEESDYYLVVPFAKFLYGPSKKNFKKIRIIQAKFHDDVRVKVIYLSLDLREDMKDRLELVN